MEVFTAMDGMTPAKLRRINDVRLYLRVVTVADLANVAGTHICDDMLTGEWTAGTDYEWPNQERPTARDFGTFRAAFRKAFSSRTSGVLRAHMSLELDKPLGAWLPVKRNTWWNVYRSEDALYYRGRTGDDLQKFKSIGKGYFKFEKDVKEVPLESSPINSQTVGELLWTHKKMNIKPSEEQEVLCPGHLINDNLPRFNYSTYLVGSDGSVHLHDKVAAAAWLLTTPGSTEHISACFLMSDISSVSSYRAELEGIFRALKHMEYLNVPPASILQWCDNELSVVNSITPPTYPKSMLDPDADLVLAIHELKNSMQHRVTLKHVYGHQDGRGKAKAEKREKRRQEEYEKRLQEWEDRSEPDSSESETEAEVHSMFNPQPSLAPSPPPKEDEEQKKVEVQVNIECDRIASETTATILAGGSHPDKTVLQMPYPGSKVMLRIGKTWITSNYKKEIYRARRTKQMKSYCMEKYGWTSEVYDSVNWDSIKTVRAKLRRSGKMQTCKIMHGWLPVMHMRQYIEGNSQCPGCNCKDETLTHLFRCKNREARRTREECLEKLLKVGKKKRIPQHIMEAICHVIKAETEGNSPIIRRTFPPQVVTAIKQQVRIGTSLMLRGFLATGWMTAMRDAGVKKPERQMNKLQQMIWETWCKPIWSTRNRILHGPDSKYFVAYDKGLSERIVWYQDHKHEVLSRCDQHMANIDVSRIHRMTRRVKKAWVKQLDKIREAFAVENRTRSRGQNAITQYLVRIADGIT